MIFIGNLILRTMAFKDFNIFTYLKGYFRKIIDIHIITYSVLALSKTDRPGDGAANRAGTFGFGQGYSGPVQGRYVRVGAYRCTVPAPLATPSPSRLVLLMAGDIMYIT